MICGHGDNVEEGAELARLEDMKEADRKALSGSVSCIIILYLVKTLLTS